MAPPSLCAPWGCSMFHCGGNPRTFPALTSLECGIPLSTPCHIFVLPLRGKGGPPACSVAPRQHRHSFTLVDPLASPLLSPLYPCPPPPPPELGVFMHACEEEMVLKSTNEKVPYFNAPVYLQNKTQIGKIDEIFGPINNVVRGVRTQYVCGLAWRCAHVAVPFRSATVGARTRARPRGLGPCRWTFLRVLLHLLSL
jgi:hypothetical protein